MARPSLFEFAGGEPAFLALAAAHHERCVQDPELNHPFSHGLKPDHVRRLALYWMEVLGGPDDFSRSHGGQSSMLDLHCGQGAPKDWNDRFVACFVQALDDVGFPDDPEFRAALGSYMEWATEDVYAYAARGSVVPPDLAVPRWSWDGLEG